MDAAASDLFSSFGFTQLIDIPTRITENTISLIDLIFEMNTERVSSHGTLPKIADHDGIIVSYDLESEKTKSKSKIIYDYNKVDENGLINFIKKIDFDTAVFQYPIIEQAELFTNVLKNAFAQFVPCKTVPIRINDQPWSNSYTRLLLRKKNRNYQLYKKINNKYIELLQKDAKPEIITKYLHKKNKAFERARDAANESTKANRRVKYAFFNSVNSTMNNSSISPKKKFQILLKLMKNNKFNSYSPFD